MNIRILGWESRGLRCPDMELYLDKQKRINFIQMPNGTGKTTLITLIKNTLSNNWIKDGILEFADSQSDKSNNGQFKLAISTDFGKVKDKITFKVDFDFVNESCSVRTTTNNDGESTGFRPNDSIKPFLTNNHVNTFLFSGDELGKYFHNSSNTVKDTIDTFSGITKIQNLIDDIDVTFKLMKRGLIGGELNKLRKTEDDFEDKKFKIQDTIDSLNLHKAKINPIYEKLKEELKDVEENEIRKNDKIITLTEELETMNSELNSFESALSEQFKNPYNIAKPLTEKSSQFLKQLEKAKLPGYAKEFLDELADKDECICGENMTSKRKENIQNNAKLYLGGDDAMIINQIKFTNNVAIEASTSESYEFNNNFNNLRQLKIDIERKNKDLKRLTVKAQKETGLYKKIKDRDKYRDVIKDLNKKINELEKIDSETYADVKSKKLNDIKSLFGVNNKLLHIGEAIAKKEGYEDERKSVDAFKTMLNKSIEESRYQIVDEIKSSLNKKIKDCHTDDTFEIDKIDNCLKIKKQKAGSGAQKVIAVTSFALAILERSGVEFPMIIDHPVMPIQDESRSSVSKMLTEACHQTITFIINSERSDFVSPPYEKRFHEFLKDIKTCHTIYRTDRNVAQPESSPDSITYKSSNCIVTDDEGFFFDFRLSGNKGDNQ
jgi:DNA sulfur modification protein DndD